MLSEDRLADEQITKQTGGGLRNMVTGGLCRTENCGCVGMDDAFDWIGVAMIKSRLGHNIIR